MSTDYEVRWASPEGLGLGVFANLLTLKYALAANSPSWLVVALPAPAVDWDALQRDQRLEVWRRPDGLGASCEGHAPFLLRKRRRYTTREGAEFVVLSAVRAIGLLARRCIPASTGTTAAEKSGAADDVMKAFVRENLGAAASAARTISSYLSVQADAGAAPTAAKVASMKMLDRTIQELALASAQGGTPLYFDIIRTGAATLEFQTWTSVRGTDRSRAGGNPFVLSQERGNLTEPSLEEDWSREATTAYAIGAGYDDLQLLTSATDSVREAASPFARIEQVVNASQVDDPTALAAEAAAAVRTARPRRTFSGKIVDTAGYGRDWGWGDLLIAEYAGQEFAVRVDSVEVSVERGLETISAPLRLED